MIRNHTGRRILRCKPRFVLAALVAATIFAPGLQGQERETEKGRFDVTAGVRMEFYGLLSPGASVQLNWDTPGNRASWLGVQFHTQLLRFRANPQAPNSDRVRRDYHFAGRFKAGFGRGDGPLFYGFAEAGIGMIGTEPEPKRGDTYLLSGIGVGAGLTLLPVTFSVEATMGRADRPSSNLLDSFVMTLQYHLP